MDAVAGLDDEGFRSRSHVGSWTVAEVLAHLLEMERILMRWAQEALINADVLFTPVTDEDRREQANLARRMAVPQLIHGLLARRRDTAHSLNGLSQPELARPLRHSSWGACTVTTLFQRVAEHEAEHAEQIRALRFEEPAPAS